jgi:hypothetical protein
VSVATQFLRDLGVLATRTITVTPKSSINNYGEVQHSGGTTYSAYLHLITGSRRDVSGDEKAYEYRVYIPSASYVPSVDDLVTFSGTTRPVMEVDIRSDEYGQQFVVLALGAARRF